MKFTNITYYIFFLFFCFGCVNKHEIVTNRKNEKYIIWNIDPPKRFKVSIQNIQTGVVYQNVITSKRCSSWKNGPKEGDTVWINTITYKDTINGQTRVFPDVTELKKLYYGY